MQLAIFAKEENDLVKGICGAEEECWIGLEEIADVYYGGTSWYWDDGSHTTYRNWDKASDLKSSFAKMNSIELGRHEGTWFNAREESELAARALVPICERPLAGPWRCSDSSCYRRGTLQVTFEEALEECAAEGAHLVIISDEEENAFVQDVCGCRACWCGCEDAVYNKPPPL